MTIILNNARWVPELLTRFCVLDLDCNPRGESMWKSQHENREPLLVSDKCYGTIEDDEQLIGKEIKAQISIDVEEISPTTKEKSFRYNNATVFVTGIYEDVITNKFANETYTSYKLDSVFPLEIREIPDGAKIGDWITVSGEPVINLPRKRNPVTDLFEPEIISLE